MVFVNHCKKSIDIMHNGFQRSRHRNLFPTSIRRVNCATVPQHLRSIGLRKVVPLMLHRAISIRWYQWFLTFQHGRRRKLPNNSFRSLLRRNRSCNRNPPQFQWFLYWVYQCLKQHRVEM